MNDFDSHDHFGDGEHIHTEEQHPMWGLDRIELKSVGIDIGSSTSHLMFSRLVLRRQGLSLSSKFRVVSREVTYESDVLLTPFVNGTTLDIQSLSAFLESVYRETGFVPSQIDTGAVIATGEAARKENARAIVALFSEQAGKFVCATAGPNLEAKMAAYGSGAVDMSWGENGEGLVIMNVDVGGGTSKIAIAQKGSVVDTVAMNVGARLFVFDESGAITRIEQPGKTVAKSLGLSLKVDYRPTVKEKRAIANALADCLFQVLERRPLSPLCQELMITPPLSFKGKIDMVTFSGGVSEYIYGHETRDYGDLGLILADAIRRRSRQPEFGIPVAQSEQGIRATVIGASQYTVQVSGSTIFVSQEGMLPLHNLPVVTPMIDREPLTAHSVEHAVTEAFRRLDLAEGEQPVALALHWTAGPSYQSLQTLVGGTTSAMKNTVHKGLPVILVFDADIARLVGSLLAQELGPGYKIISIDGIELQDFDYIDIGKELPQAGVVPVAIKSLVFRADKF